VVELVSDLLDASRLEAGVLQLNKTEVDVAVLAKEVVGRLKILADGHDIAGDGPERAVVLADRDRLEQVLTNLLSNAMRYSPEGGRVDVTVQAHPEWMQISVRDRGLGVPKDQQLRIF